VRHLELLVHPAAGGGRTIARLRRLVNSNAVPGALRCAVQPVASVEEVVDRLRRLHDGAVPVAAGGDGTLNMVAQGISTARLAVPRVGLLPLGTANLMARELGIRSTREAFEALTGDAVRQVDLMATDHPNAPLALVSFSAGFESAFIHRYARYRRYGRPVGALAGLSAPAARDPHVALTLDGAVVVGPDEGAFTVGLYNTMHYPGGAVMIPGGDPSDGHGDAVVYRSAAAYWSAATRALLRLDPPTGDTVLRRRWRTAIIRSDRALQADGEAIEAGEVRVELVPAVLNVLVPALSRGGR